MTAPLAGAARRHPRRIALLSYALGEAPEPHDLVHDLTGGLAVAARVARILVEAHRLTKDHRDRLAAAEVPVLGALERGRNDWDALVDRDHRGACLGLTGDARALPGALDEHAQKMVLANRLAHAPERVAI